MNDNKRLEFPSTQSGSLFAFQNKKSLLYGTVNRTYLYIVLRENCRFSRVMQCFTYGRRRINICCHGKCSRVTRKHAIILKWCVLCFVHSLPLARSNVRSRINPVCIGIVLSCMYIQSLIVSRSRKDFTSILFYYYSLFRLLVRGCAQHGESIVPYTDESSCRRRLYEPPSEKRFSFYDSCESVYWTIFIYINILSIFLYNLLQTLTHSVQSHIGTHTFCRYAASSPEPETTQFTYQIIK